MHGTVTLHTARPLSRAQLLPTLQALLADVGAAVVQGNGLTRIVPAAAAGVAGTTVLPLRYASAEELVKVLQPLAGPNARIAAEPWRNAVVIAAPPGQVEPLAELVRSFDVDELAGRSYAVLPVTSGNARDFAEALREALRGRAAAAPVQVVPLPRFDAVLVAASQPRFIEAATRVYTLLERERRRTVRSWHVHYLQNSNADDIAYTLQMAFTPNNVTAQPAAQTGAGQRRTAGASGQSGSGLGGLGGSGGIGAAGGMGGAGGIGGAGGMGGAGGLSRGGGLTGQGGTASGSHRRRSAGRRDHDRPAGRRQPAAGRARSNRRRGQSRRAAHPVQSAEQCGADLCDHAGGGVGARRCCARSTSPPCRCASTPPSPR